MPIGPFQRAMTDEPSAITSVLDWWRRGSKGEPPHLVFRGETFGYAGVVKKPKPMVWPRDLRDTFLVMASASAGIDSTAAVLQARARWPKAPMILVRADTGYEPEDSDEILRILARKVGAATVTLLAFEDLYAMIRGYGRLPNAGVDAWCSQNMKGGRLDNFGEWFVKGRAKNRAVNVTGLLAGEPARIEKHVRLQSDKQLSAWRTEVAILAEDETDTNKRDAYKLSKKHGIPFSSTYAERRRHGCVPCRWWEEAQWRDYYKADRAGFMEAADLEEEVARTGKTHDRGTNPAGMVYGKVLRVWRLGRQDQYPDGLTLREWLLLWDRELPGWRKKPREFKGITEERDPHWSPGEITILPRRRKKARLQAERAAVAQAEEDEKRAAKAAAQAALDAKKAKLEEKADAKGAKVQPFEIRRKCPCGVKVIVRNVNVKSSALAALRVRFSDSKCAACGEVAAVTVGVQRKRRGRSSRGRSSGGRRRGRGALFHATVGNASAIMREGLRVDLPGLWHDQDPGWVYFTDNATTARGFVEDYLQESGMHDEATITVFRVDPRLLGTTEDDPFNEYPSINSVRHWGPTPPQALSVDSVWTWNERGSRRGRSSRGRGSVKVSKTQITGKGPKGKTVLSLRKLPAVWGSTDEDGFYAPELYLSGRVTGLGVPSLWREEAAQQRGKKVDYRWLPGPTRLSVYVKADAGEEGETHPSYIRITVSAESERRVGVRGAWEPWWEDLGKLEVAPVPELALGVCGSFKSWGQFDRQFVVVEADVGEYAQGRGVGGVLYALAAALVAGHGGGLVPSHACRGHTSEEARRTWRGLGRDIGPWEDLIIDRARLKRGRSARPPHWIKNRHGWTMFAHGFLWNLSQSPVSRAWTLYKSQLKKGAPEDFEGGPVVTWWDSPIPMKKVGKRWVIPKRTDSRRWSLRRAKTWAKEYIK